MTNILNKILPLLLLAMGSALAAAEECFADGIRYSLDRDGRTAQVVRPGSGITYEDTVSIPATVTCGGTEYSVTAIGEQAFEGCAALVSVVIAEGIRSIGNGAFRDCTALTSVEIPGSVSDIGLWTWAGCCSLRSMEVAGGNAKYDSRQGCNAIIETATNTLLHGCMNSSVPGSVESIGRGAFKDCVGLTAIDVPGSVRTIGDYAFSGCTALVSVVIAEGVRSIGNGAFELCRSLPSVEIPGSVTILGFGAFEQCRALEDVTCRAATPPACDGSTFLGVDKKKTALCVPRDAAGRYRQAKTWRNFSDIRGLEETAARTVKDRGHSRHKKRTK